MTLPFDVRTQLLRHAWFVTGPTASGKSAIGLELAKRLGGEIISLDSMAIYRGLDIITAKPTAAEQREAPHHLIDIRDPHEDFSVAQYLDLAWTLVQQIIERGKVPIFVGGTPLYLKALLRGLFEGPAADWGLRNDLLQMEETAGAGALHQMLAQLDPTSAARLHPHDTRRLIRAVEVFRLTGRPLSDWQNEFDMPFPKDRCRVFTLWWDVDELNRRIDQRARAMVEQGVAEEILSLASRGIRLGRTASQTIGYDDILTLARSGAQPEAFVRQIAQRTRQFAKRQRTWFRQLEECRFVPLTPLSDVNQVLEEIVYEGELSLI